MLTAEQVRAADKFAQPAVGIGETVEWMPSLHEQGEVTMGFVVGIGERNIALYVFKKSGGGLKFISGARHIEDPIAADKTLHSKDGVWRKQRMLGNLDQAMRLIQDLERENAQLKARMTAVEDQLEQSDD